MQLETLLAINSSGQKISLKMSSFLHSESGLYFFAAWAVHRGKVVNNHQRSLVCVTLKEKRQTAREYNEESLCFTAEAYRKWKHEPLQMVPNTKVNEHIASIFRRRSIYSAVSKRRQVLSRR